MYIAMHTAAAVGPAKKARPVNKARSHNQFSHYLNQMNTERNPSPVCCDLILRQHAVQIGTIYTPWEPHTLQLPKYTSSVSSLEQIYCIQPHLKLACFIVLQLARQPNLKQDLRHDFLLATLQQLALYTQPQYTHLYIRKKTLGHN